MEASVTTIRLATRPSALALRQTELATEWLRGLWPKAEISVLALKSDADVRPSEPIQTFGDKGLFVARIERALLDGEADIAVHSLKDLPTQSPDSLQLAAFLPRDDARDVVVSHSGSVLAQLPSGSQVGTSSIRRQAQLEIARPDLAFADIRGNVETRLAKLDDGDFDAIVLAAAGLSRLGLEDRITEYLDPAVCTPAPGQGVIALQCRSGSRFVKLLSSGEDSRLKQIVVVERLLASSLEADCSTPFGALATADGDHLRLRAFLRREDGVNRRAEASGVLRDVEDIVAAAANQLLSN